MDELRAAAEASKAWPFEEARRLLRALSRTAPPAKGHVLFETGYGPSGLPHIGTFGEVARTTMIRRAFEAISDIPTRLICFSDDMDGMRKVPDNVPNPEMLREHLQRPLTAVPDPFGDVRELRRAQQRDAAARSSTRFGFEYEFVSATEYYRSGRFDAVLLRAAERYDAIMEVMLAEPARGAAADLFVLPADLAEHRAGALRADEGGERARRHDHLRRRGRARDDAAGDRRPREAAVEARLRRALGGARRRLRDVRQGPRDQHADLRRHLRDPRRAARRSISSTSCSSTRTGRRSRSRRATGCRMDEWLAYASPESLSLFMYGKPKTAKRLYFDVIPKAMDEYHQHLRAFAGAGRGGAAGEPGLAHPRRAAAGLGHGGALLDAPEPRERGRRRRTRRCSGASSASTRPRRARRPTRGSTRRRATRCATSRTS